MLHSGCGSFVVMSVSPCGTAGSFLSPAYAGHRIYSLY
ncbi:hypothetical protein LHGZ1_1458 [Laribacter hongkongensis]|uniref:Uncharacterized protein n=1 Tax=Laribacter hongkongensis TaxID=168471 RepID=A0A248LIG5_9NEIS|nr:hypothetical protein LHGZ1_1458 [Laribacter hongkongensis]